jgi:hypothetical protein
LQSQLWTIDKLHYVLMIQMQKDALDSTSKSSGVQETPYRNFIPAVACVIVPILHLFLGLLGKDILDAF